MLCIFNWGCKKRQADLAKSDKCIMERQLPALTLPEEKAAFLEKIFDRDQHVRNNNAQVCGQNHESISCAKTRLISAVTDYNNLFLIKQYLNQYGYPPSDEFEEIPHITPWTVIHHTVGLSAELDKELSTYLIEAWENSQLESQKLLWYLKRRFQIVHKKEFVSNTKNETEQIKELLQFF